MLCGLDGPEMSPPSSSSQLSAGLKTRSASRTLQSVPAGTGYVRGVAEGGQVILVPDSSMAGDLNIYCVMAARLPCWSSNVMLVLQVLRLSVLRLHCQCRLQA